MTPFSRASASSGSAALDVPHLGDVRMLVERVVVDGELRVERLHLAVGRDDQRIDLAEHRVAADEGVVELADDGGDLLLLALVLDARAVDQAAGLPGLEPFERVDVQPDERVGILLGDLLDVHSTLRGEHQKRLLHAPVERDREVVLLLDVGCALDPERPHDVPADVETEDLFRLLLRVRRVVCELDPARLAAAARQHLGLHHDRAADLLGRRTGLLGRRRSATVRDRDAEALEELLALILVEVQSDRDLSCVDWSDARATVSRQPCSCSRAAASPSSSR